MLGVPFDANSSFKRGPARAPAAIRRSMGSDAGNPYSESGVRVWPSAAVIDHGDLKVPAKAGSRAPIDAIAKRVSELLAATPRLLVLGGDHAVSYPVVRAFAERDGKLDLLHFDAHPDLYPEFEGNRYSHASPMARILEDGCVGRLVQVGIRSVSPRMARNRPHTQNGSTATQAPVASHDTTANAVGVIRNAATMLRSHSVRASAVTPPVTQRA